MADAITIKALQDASLDAKSLEEVVNGNESKQVTTRLGETYPSVKKAVKTLFENGGLPAKPFPTLAKMNTDGASLADGQLAMVYNETANNGLYEKVSGTWVKAAYDPLAQAKDYADDNKLDKKDVLVGYIGGNLIGPLTRRRSNAGINIINVISLNTPSYDMTVVPLTTVKASKLALYNADNNYFSGDGASIGFYATDPLGAVTPDPLSVSIVTKTNEDGLVYREAIIPDGAKFLVLNHTFRPASTSRPVANMDWTVQEDTLKLPSVKQSPVFIGLVDAPLLVADKPDPRTVYFNTHNLYEGSPQIKIKTFDGLVANTTLADDIVSPYIPVTTGKTYTLSGLDPSKTAGRLIYIQGMSDKLVSSRVTLLASGYGTTITFTVSDPLVKYIIFQLVTSGNGTLNDADLMPVQVEEGAIATPYQPSLTNMVILKAMGGMKNAGGASIVSNYGIKSDFVELYSVRDPYISTVTPFSKGASPVGVGWSMKGDAAIDNASNTLAGTINITDTGSKKIHAYLCNRMNDVKVAGKLSAKRFTIPSGSLDNPDTLPTIGVSYPKDIYVHPSVAYNATGVAGFKYWLIASTFPPLTMGDTQWEDEDVFVSNDGDNWQRIRSMYETDKSYTTSALRLPPQTLVTNNARKNAFLPCPASGTTIEVSTPAHNGAAMQDREVITLSGLPWKHDPFILIDGGYVYTYHTFHLCTDQKPNTDNRFIVCVRTNDGINWDVVRTDGSTMRLTEASSKTIFTKSADGKYNYMRYMYKTSGMNPEILKYGTGDYELLYGANFAYRHKGTTPYNFDWETKHPFHNLGSGHHPTAFLHDNALYVINQKGMYKSTNRGELLTRLPYYPCWLGGIDGMSYKKTVCTKHDGKLMLIDVQHISAQAADKTPTVGVNGIFQMFFYDFPSTQEFVDLATNGVQDSYLDIQLVKINYTSKKRTIMNMPAVNTKVATGIGKLALSRQLLGEIDVEAGDIIYLFVTMNSRNGAEIQFGGIEIS